MRFQISSIFSAIPIKSFQRHMNISISWRSFWAKRSIRLEPNRGFDHWLDIYDGFLPNPRSRWCTKKLKIEPLEKFIGDDETVSYIAIRADEDRVGYISTKPNIKPVFPFMRDGLVKRDIFRIIEESGIGMPDYYSWRSRSGCFFCFFQRKVEWVRLYETHRDLFEEAVKYEQEHSDSRKYYWNQEESLHGTDREERSDNCRPQKDYETEKEEISPTDRLLRFSTLPLMMKLRISVLSATYDKMVYPFKEMLRSCDNTK